MSSIAAAVIARRAASRARCGRRRRPAARSPCERVEDHQRDQLLRKLVAARSCSSSCWSWSAAHRCGGRRAPGDRTRPCSPSRASSARRACVSVNGAVLGPQRAVDLVGRDVVEAVPRQRALLRATRVRAASSSACVPSTLVAMKASGASDRSVDVRLGGEVHDRYRCLPSRSRRLDRARDRRCRRARSGSARWPSSGCEVGAVAGVGERVETPRRGRAAARAASAARSSRR